jgi:hypothetical protein
MGLKMVEARAHVWRAIGVRRQSRILLPGIEQLDDAALIYPEGGMAIAAIGHPQTADDRDRIVYRAARRRIVGQNIGAAEGVVLIRAAEAGLQIDLRHPDELRLPLVGNMRVLDGAAGNKGEGKRKRIAAQMGVPLIGVPAS